MIAMRADGEISKDEYQAMRSPVDEEIKKLQKALDEIPQEKSNPKGLDIEGIRSTLNSFIDFSGSTISHDVVNQFVYLITPTSDTTFDWYVNLNGTADVKATFTAEGRKKNCIIKLEEIEKISSVHREKNEDNAHFIKNPHIFTYLHRQLSRATRHNLKHIIKTPSGANRAEFCVCELLNRDIRPAYAKRAALSRPRRDKTVQSRLHGQLFAKDLRYGVIAESEIFERPDYRVEFEENNVDHGDKRSEEGREVVSLGHVDLVEFLARHAEHEGLRIADAVAAGDIESDIQARLVEQVGGVQVKGSFAALDILFTLDDIAV